MLGVNAEMIALVRMPSGPPGAIAIVQRGGRQLVFSAGVAELGTSTPVTAADHADRQHLESVQRRGGTDARRPAPAVAR